MRHFTYERVISQTLNHGSSKMNLTLSLSLTHTHTHAHTFTHIYTRLDDTGLFWTRGRADRAQKKKWSLLENGLLTTTPPLSISSSFLSTYVHLSVGILCAWVIFLEPFWHILRCVLLQGGARQAEGLWLRSRRAQLGLLLRSEHTLT